MPKKVIIIGAGGHAKVIAETILKSGDEVVGFLDDNETIINKNIYLDKKVIGKINDCKKFKECFFIVGIGNNKIRQKISNNLKLNWYTAIHPSAIIATDAVIGEGTAIMPGAIVNPGTTIGRHCIINTAATIDHDNKIGDFVHVSPGAHLAGTVSIGNATWICMGVSVINNINIAPDNIIGADATVMNDVMEESNTYIGTPAHKREKK